MKTYYFLEGANKIGPLTSEQLSSRHLADDTLVYNPDTNSWCYYGEIKDKIINDANESNIVDVETSRICDEFNKNVHSTNNTEEKSLTETQADSISKKNEKTKEILSLLLFVILFCLIFGPRILARYYEKKAQVLLSETLEKNPDFFDNSETTIDYKQYNCDGLHFTYPSNYIIYMDTIVNGQVMVRCKNPNKRMEKIQFTIELIDNETKKVLNDYSRKEICQQIYEISIEEFTNGFKKYDITNRKDDYSDNYYSISVDFSGTLEYEKVSGTMQGKLKVMLMDDYIIRCNTFTETEEEETTKVFESMTFTP